MTRQVVEIIGKPHWEFTAVLRCIRYFTEFTCRCNSSAVALKLDPMCRERPDLSVKASPWARKRGGPPPSIDVADSLFDDRRELTGCEQPLGGKCFSQVAPDRVRTELDAVGCAARRSQRQTQRSTGKPFKRFVAAPPQK